MMMPSPAAVRGRPRVLDAVAKQRVGKPDTRQDPHAQGIGLNWAQREAWKCCGHMDDWGIEQNRCSLVGNVDTRITKRFIVDLIGS